MPKNNMDFQRFETQIRFDKTKFGEVSQVTALKPNQMASFNRRKTTPKFIAWFNERRLRRSMVKRFKASQSKSTGNGEMIVIAAVLMVLLVFAYGTQPDARLSQTTTQESH